MGDTAAKVEARILGLVQNADAQPWQYTNFPVPVDGALVGSFAAADDTMWEPAALVLKALATAAHSGPAPQALLDAVHLVDGPPPPGPAGAPKAFDTTAANAYLCNEDTSPRDFSSQWAEYRRNLRENPVTGDTDAQRPSCAGWSLPVQSFELRRSSGSLQLSGHLHENVTPYPWAEQMQDAIGGTVFTVKDSVHGSMPFVADCAAHITAYFDTGKADSGTCRGEPPVHLPAADGAA